VLNDVLHITERDEVVAVLDRTPNILRLFGPLEQVYGSTLATELLHVVQDALAQSAAALAEE